MIITNLIHRFEAKGEERGFILAFSALFMTTLIGIGGFSVDIGNWYLHALRLQRAADSAALAGSIYLPNDITSARSVAQNAINQNNGSNYTSSIMQSSTNPTRLQVTATETVNNYFTSMLGYNSITLSRKATAEYRPYVPMGSPSNVLGVEYNAADSWEKAATKGKQNRYWMNISGPTTPKSTGDRYSSGDCTSSISNCSPGSPIPTRNIDYSSEGQTFVIRIPPTVSGILEIQAFDPVFADVGDNCEKSFLTAGTPNPQAINSLYTPNGTSQCTGDNLQASGPAPNTKFAVYTPELSPGGSTLVTDTNCQSVTYPGYTGNIINKVNPALGTYDSQFTAAFRKWTSICKMYVNGATNGGDYLLRVSVSNLAGNGLNRYALRAGIVTAGGFLDVSQTQNIQLFSKGRLVVYARDNTGNVTFYLARINSGAAGRTMIVTLFDIGDATDPTTLKLLPPDDATDNNVAMTQFSNCQYTPPSSTVYTPTAGGCSISGITSTNYNGKIVNIKVNIPEDYKCTDADTNSCWTRLALTYGAGSVTDTTSWEVSLNGNPVHLIVE